MEPIVLTQFGETLLEYPGSKSTDQSKIFSCIGIHGICECWIDLKPVSKTHNIIKCRNCGLRIALPKEIDTYGKLRQWCANQIEDEKQRGHYLATLIVKNMFS